MGSNDAAIPQKILANAILAKQQSIEMRVERTRASFEEKRKRERKTALAKASLGRIDDYPGLFNTVFDSSWRIECPSCTAKAYMAGEMVSEEVVEVQGDEYGVWETVEREFNGEQFRCAACGLKLDGYDELKFANLQTDYEDTDEREMEYEPEYGNE